MTKDDLIQLCEREKEEFADILSNRIFAAKAILNSELLLPVALAKHFGVSTVIESGRARGYSAAVMASTLPSPLVSVERDRFSYDALLALRTLNTFGNIRFVYGNAMMVLPNLISDSCLVLIDGPKGIDAVRLAAALLVDAKVKAVCVHDLHRDSVHRPLAESVFSDHFFTDDETYVAAFKYLDGNCWKLLNQKGYTPYTRGTRRMKSYASTLALFLNSDKPLRDGWRERLDAFEHGRPWSHHATAFGRRSCRRVAAGLSGLCFAVPVLYYERMHERAIRRRVESRRGGEDV